MLIICIESIDKYNTFTLYFHLIFSIQMYSEGSHSLLLVFYSVATLFWSSFIDLTCRVLTSQLYMQDWFFLWKIHPCLQVKYFQPESDGTVTPRKPERRSVPGREEDADEVEVDERVFSDYEPESSGMSRPWSYWTPCNKYMYCCDIVYIGKYCNAL